MSAHGDDFTAAEIARAIGCSKQNIHCQLSRVPCSREKLVNGNLAKCWTLDSLPSAIVRQLSIKAESKGFRTVTQLLSLAFSRYELSMPLREIAPEAIARARRLQTALRRLLPTRNDTSVPAREFDRRGAEAYKREFGHAITSKHWRLLFERTVERDNGAEEWERIEIYLEENPPAVSAGVTLRRRGTVPLTVLEDALNACAGSSKLSVDQTTYLWTKACDELQLQVDAAANLKRAKRSIIEALVKSGFVGADFDSVRRNFSRKFGAYSAAAGKLQDGRQLRYAKAAPVVGQDDRSTLIAASLDRGGRVSQAFRETFQSGALSEELTDRYIANPTRKSYVPHSVRKAVAAEVKRLMPLHHGPREHELRGAYATRDWSTLSAGDSYQADDCTCPVLYWETDPSNRFGYRVIRGQLLLMIDERSLLALGFALHSENNYNARIIRALITRVHDNFGLPRRRFYFERGIWRSSKILTGQATPAGELALGHTELGLREFGVQFCHAKLPRGKVIERVLGLFQNQLERLPGYVGRDERNDRFERVQSQLSEARSGSRHPSEMLMSKEQWEDELAEILREYNSERRGGRILNGLSPLEAWNKLQAAEPQVHLGDKARYLLAHHKLKMRVGRNGITLRPSLGGGTYHGAGTGPFVGEDVLVWFNPEEPDYIALTSLDRKRGPVVVPREEPLPAIGASKEQMARSKALIDAHNAHAKTTYRLIAPELAAHSFRRLGPIDSQTVRTGEEMRAQVEQVKAQQSRTRSSVRKVQTLSRHLNLRPSAELTAVTAERMAEGLDLIAESRRLRSCQKNSECDGSSKVFVLDAPPQEALTTKQRNGIYWRLYKAAVAAQPGLNRFAVTTSTIGSVKKIAEMTDKEFRKVCHIFKSIAGKEQAK
jgi:hypothetical protein